jgi:hypothetical protein
MDAHERHLLAMVAIRIDLSVRLSPSTSSDWIAVKQLDFGGLPRNLNALGARGSE